jgi:DNA-binding transcriptional MerR regulator
MPYKAPKIEKVQYHIREVAEMFDVNISLIRYWEKEFDILKPNKNEKGTRYFTPKDIESFHLIFHLVKERGLTLDGVKRKLKDNRGKILKNFEVVSRLTSVKHRLLSIRKEIEDVDSE